MAGFTQLLEVVARSTGQLEGFTGGPSQAPQPTLARVDRLKELLARVSGDLSSLEKQVEQADSTFGAEAVSDSSGFLGPEEPPLVVHQATERLQPPSSLPDHSFIVFSNKLQCSSVSK